MPDYQDSDLFPVPRDKVWALLNAHLDGSRIGKIHPLILEQRTARQDGADTYVDRSIDVRGRPMRSTWKYTFRPPELLRWEVVESEGPWAKGSFIENRYAEEPGGTRITSQGNLKVAVLPFFLPQKPVIRKVLADIDAEDLAFAKRL